MRDRLFLILAPALAFVSPVLATMAALALPISSSVPMIALGAISVCGLALGCVAAILMPGDRSGNVRDVLFVGVLLATILLFVDLAAGGHDLLGRFASGRLGKVATLIVVCFAIFAAVWLVRRKAALILFAGSAFLFASTIVKDYSFGTNTIAAPSLAPLDSSKRPFVYVVFDEAMGIEGVERAPGGAIAAAEMKSTLERHGFRLYGRAFSRHYVSARSIPNTINFDFSDESYGPVLRHHKDLKISSSLFEGLAEDGYGVVSYATAHESLDFCFVVATRCEVLQSFNPFNEFLPDDGAKADAFARVMWHAFAESYVVYNLMPALTDSDLSRAPAVDSSAFPLWFDKFSKDLMSSPKGHAFFAHMLFPHSPYVYGADCRKSGADLTGYFLAENAHLSGTALDAERTRQFSAYLAQYRCLATKLDGLLSGLEQTPGYEEATIVFHGDHGARISAGQFAESQSDRDMIDNYSALYAIKRPDIEPGYDTRQVSIQRLTAEYFSGNTPAELGPDNQIVVIDSKEPGRVVLREMPSFGS